jgi:hypothetical protein
MTRVVRVECEWVKVREVETARVERAKGVEGERKC